MVTDNLTKEDVEKEIKKFETKTFINANKRKHYKNKEELEEDEKKLELSLKQCDNKFQMIIYLPLTKHLIEERKRLVGLRVGEKIKFKMLKVQMNIFKKRLGKWGVVID